MKKWILTLALVTLFTVGASAFTDISDAEENRAASSLSSLGIVNGTSGGLYSPDGYLTRAEFCKMAVLLLGDKDYLSFKNYTLFPDVPYTNWAAAYINCAVKKRAILRGFSDGSFKPGQNITYAQAVTVALNSLGYKSEDIGAIWPQDYIAKAQEIGLLDGLRSFSPDAPATRGQTAVLLRNTLITKTKAGNLLLDDSFDTVTGNAILLATPQNDASISENYAEFYIGSEKAVKKSENALMAPLIGTSGYLVTDAANPGLAKGFVCDSKKSVRSKVKKSYPAKLETYDGSFDIPDDAKVIASGNVSKYNEGWFDLSSDTPINIFYDSEGKISLVSVESADMSGTAYVFGTTSVAALPANSKVIKNGNPASA
ncbi:MAG: S-layer homology domain-containing protein, partial [Bacillota bacterium]|nr:S-layer homology domain-containing protein [Bacillota bacterium]